MLIDRDAIARENGGWSVRERVDDVELPDSIHGVIASRVDLLDAASREALRRCSVMGRVFWPSAVGVDDEVIAALERKALVGEHPESTVAGMREFAFKHALTQDVTYSTLPRAERRELHRRVGVWVEDVAPGREAEMAEVAAYHLDRALEYGETAPEVRRPVLRAAPRRGRGSHRSGRHRHCRAAARESRRAGGRRPRSASAALVGLGRANLMSADLDQGHAQLRSGARHRGSSRRSPAPRRSAQLALSRELGHRPLAGRAPRGDGGGRGTRRTRRDLAARAGARAPLTARDAPAGCRRRRRARATRSRSPNALATSTQSSTPARTFSSRSSTVVHRSTWAPYATSSRALSLQVTRSRRTGVSSTRCGWARRD